MPSSSLLPRVFVCTANLRRNYARLARMRAQGGAAPIACVSGSGGQGGSGACPPAAEGGGPLSGCWPALLPVVKADAYGHGHIAVSKALIAEGAQAFASGSVAEAVLLRTGLAAQGLFPKIVALLGIVTREDAAAAAAHAVVPVVHSLWQLDCLQENASRPLYIAIKCNSGMARLGFNEEELPALLARLDTLPGVIPALALTHLASADTPDGIGEVQGQARRFAAMLQALRTRRPDLPASLCNSAGTLLAGCAEGILGPHICRPGIVLYGDNPLAGTPFAAEGEGFLPAMRVETPLLAVRMLRKGESIGYSRTFRAPEDMPVGIAAMGYADGFSRGLSGRGVVSVRGARAPVVGRVSMQMSAVDLRAVPGVEAMAAGNNPGGEKVTLLGGEGAGAVSAAELAALWGTISYEVFCLLGNNPREYDGEA